MSDKDSSTNVKYFNNSPTRDYFFFQYRQDNFSEKRSTLFRKATPINRSATKSAIIL